MAIDWDRIRKNFVAQVPPPPGWPKSVRPISTEGVSLHGIDPATNKLYWDGKEIVFGTPSVSLGLSAFLPSWLPSAPSDTSS